MVEPCAPLFEQQLVLDTSSCLISSLEVVNAMAVVFNLCIVLAFLRTVGHLQLLYPVPSKDREREPREKIVKGPPVETGCRHFGTQS